MVGVKTLGEFPTILACLRAMVEDDNLDSVVALVANRSYAGDQFRAEMMEAEKALRDLGVRAKQVGKPMLLVRRSMAHPINGIETTAVDAEDRLPEFANLRRVPPESSATCCGTEITCRFRRPI